MRCGSRTAAAAATVGVFEGGYELDSSSSDESDRCCVQTTFLGFYQRYTATTRRRLASCHINPACAVCRTATLLQCSHFTRLYSLPRPTPNRMIMIDIRLLA